MKTWNWPQFVLAMLALSGLVALAIIEQWFGKVADEGTKQILIGLATLAFAFFFQSSSGSKAKDDTVADQAATIRRAAIASTPLVGTGTPAKVEIVSSPDKPVAVKEAT